MSRFTNILTVSPFADGKTWYLCDDFGYEIGAEGSGKVIDVPAGFATDFASIPVLFCALLPKWQKYGNAAVIHDFLYYEQTTARKYADDILWEAMGVLNVPRWKKVVIYLGVRWGGWWAWFQNGRKRKKGRSKIAHEPVKSIDRPVYLHFNEINNDKLNLSKGKIL